MSLDSVTFWINAFIPNSVCAQKGDVFVVEVPDLQGLPIPVTRFFTGDQREFSNDRNASARLHSEVSITGLSGDNPEFIEFQWTGISHEVDGNGNVIAEGQATTDRMRFYNFRGDQTVDPESGVIDGIPGSIQIDLEGSAALPLVAFAPDIDYAGTLMIDRQGGKILFKGAVNGFPSYELYVQSNAGPVITMAQIPAGSPIDLIGLENLRVDVVAPVVLG